jgi:hypothetical protein
MTIYLTTLVVHGSGAINVGYVQDTPPGSPTSSTVDFWFVRSTDGGAKFSTKVKVFEAAKKVGFVYSAAMALDPTGNPVFVYDASVDSTSLIFDIFLSVSKDGVSFQAAVNLSQTSGSNSSAFASDPAIAIDATGSINVVYLREDFRTSERDVYFTGSGDGGAHFSEPVNATHTANLCIYLFAPSVGIDGNKNIGITWQALTASLLYPGGLDVFFSQSSDGGKAFSPVINISDNIGQVETRPFIIVSRNGQMNVFWQDETGGNDQLLALAFGSGVSGPPQQVTPPSNLVVTPDQFGQITLSWTASPEATSYTIKRRSDSEPEFTTIAIGVTSNSFVDRHLEAGNAYYYSVIAVNANQESPASNAASAMPVGSIVLEDKIWLLPTAARSSGLSGSFFTTDVWISNASEASVNLTLEFLQAGGQNNAEPPKSTLLLAAHETRSVPNILESLFGVQSNQFGPIRFTVPGAAADSVAIVSRTFTPSADEMTGTYGLAVEARDVTATGTSALSLVGLRQNAAFRSNVGIINLTDHTATHTLTLLSSSGATLATGSRQLPAYATSQSSLISLFPSAANDSSNLDGLTVVVSSPDATLMAYASSVDNNTGDGSFVSGLPVQTHLSGGTHYVPVVTKVTGAFGTEWSSRLAAFNPGLETVTLFFSLHLPKSDNREVIPVQQALGPKATLVFSDVLEQLLHKASGYGALQVDWIASSGTAPIFSSQTATPAAGKAGTYGLQVDPVTLSHATRSLRITGVQQDDRFRTNIGFANPTNEVVSLSCVLRKADGSTASAHSLTMHPLDYFQMGFNELFTLSSGPKSGEVMTVDSQRSDIRLRQPHRQRHAGPHLSSRPTVMIRAAIGIVNPKTGSSNNR